ncbi:MAG: DUF3450 domain-containing protein [Gammaproteobacteria bacterium]|nr:DUF3450 domain-containing protein [Gammaproteobacteria bacterium]
MNEHLIRSALGSAFFALALIVTPGQAMAQSLEDVLGVRSQTTVAGVRSQQKVNEIFEETQDLETQYNNVMKIVDGLRVYNRQQRKLIENQEKEMVELQKSIEDAQVVERQITPLIERMIDALEKFVALDVPFLIKERTERIAFLKEMMGRADVTAAEKFNQVMQAYQVENTYGSTIEAYSDMIEIEAGSPRQVDVLRFGRVSLVFQTPDGEITGAWDNNERQWTELGDEYRTEVRDALRMARKTATPDLVRLPVVAPGE